MVPSSHRRSVSVWRGGVPPMLARCRRTRTCRTPCKRNLRRSNELLESISHLRGRGALYMRTDELRAHVLAIRFHLSLTIQRYRPCQSVAAHASARPPGTNLSDRVETVSEMAVSSDC